MFFVFDMAGRDETREPGDYPRGSCAHHHISLMSARESEHILPARETLDSEWILPEWLPGSSRGPAALYDISQLLKLEHATRIQMIESGVRPQALAVRNSSPSGQSPSPDIYATPGGNPRVGVEEPPFSFSFSRRIRSARVGCQEIAEMAWELLATTPAVEPLFPSHQI